MQQGIHQVKFRFKITDLFKNYHGDAKQRNQIKQKSSPVKKNILFFNQLCRFIPVEKGLFYTGMVTGEKYPADDIKNRNQANYRYCPISFGYRSKVRFQKGIIHALQK